MEVHLYSVKAKSQARVQLEHSSHLVKGYLRYKMITPQNVLSGAQVKNFFYFVEMLCSVLKIFKFLSF